MNSWIFFKESSCDQRPEKGVRSIFLDNEKFMKLIGQCIVTSNSNIKPRILVGLIYDSFGAERLINDRQDSLNEPFCWRSDDERGRAKLQKCKNKQKVGNSWEFLKPNEKFLKLNSLNVFNARINLSTITKLPANMRILFNAQFVYVRLLFLLRRRSRRIVCR